MDDLKFTRKHSTRLKLGNEYVKKMSLMMDKKTDADKFALVLKYFS